MTLPVSKYEELLETVRNLKHQTIRVRELASPLLDTIISANTTNSSCSDNTIFCSRNQVWGAEPYFEGIDDALSLTSGNYIRSASVMDSMMMERQKYDDGGGGRGLEDYASQISSSSEPTTSSNAFRAVNAGLGSTWPSEKASNMWHSEPAPLNLSTHNRNRYRQPMSSNGSITPTDMTSVMSFATSSGAAPLDLVLTGNNCKDDTSQRQQQLDVKVDMVYSLLAVLGMSECPDMGQTLLALSSSADSSRAMRQAGCLPVLVQLVHSKFEDELEGNETREKAGKALRNLVEGQMDDRSKKRELKVLKLLEDIRNHCFCKDEGKLEEKVVEADVHHPIQSTENIIKLSFDEDYRHTICELGGIYTLARLVEIEHNRHGSLPTSDKCITLRRYAGMALTNLTFGHGVNKSLLCSFNQFMKCLVVQLSSTSDELRQVTASVLRNLSWRADTLSRTALRESGAVISLMHAAIRSKREATLKSILSALWNLSAHCSTNKAEICAVPGALAFLVDMLGFRPPSRTLTIIENSGGILRNVSSHIAIRDDYRSVLREKNCLPLLLQQLKSPSLTVVSNACGTLWNLSAKCEEDQKTLWDLGAAPMLRSLNCSKHVMIATGSRAALKNLLSSRPANSLFNHMDNTAKEMGLTALPTLGVRKQRALIKELDQNLSETCDNIEPTSPPPQQSVTDLSSSFCTRQSKYNNDEPVIEAFASLTLNDKPTKLRDYSAFKYEEEASEEPINYSTKYAEEKDVQNKRNALVKDAKKTVGSPESSPFGDYAETDLDQPTNYSLRYAEDDSDLDESDAVEIETKPPQVIQATPPVAKNPTPSEQFYEEQFDTVKTYYTEGTPLNFSTATSMSDLRQIETPAQIDEDIENTEIEEKPKILPQLKIKSEFSSGLLTPEKPVKYCEEGTPRTFSRHSSFSSLNLDDSKTDNCVPVVENKLLTEEQNEVKLEPNNDSVENETMENSKLDDSSLKQEGSNAAKVVTFNEVVRGAEETPLMFSRCSSLGSLSSADQPDDRSSIVSEFSRLTSGIISPSDIPDSPTQTVPPSPRHRKAPVDFGAICGETGPATSSPNNRNTPPQKSVFEDNVIKFKEDNTPVEFSTNTSLSSLTIDDDIGGTNIAAFNILQKPIDENVLPIGEDDDEEAENDMLAACINIGMQNNRIKKEPRTMMSPPISSMKSPQKTGIPIKNSGNKPLESKLPLPMSLNARTTPNVVDSPVNLDSTRTYCTEDTPAFLSQAGSQTDLSVLSFDSSNNKDSRKVEKILLDLSDDSSNLSGDNEDNILAECIQSGMPKARRCLPIPSGTVPKSLPTNLRQKINKTVSNLTTSAKDEIENYEVEDSPCQFSLRSSLSDLTVDGVPVAKRILSPLSKKEENVEAPLEVLEVLSRAESLSSLSVESFGSTENAEQALLEQCISAGLPPAKTNTSKSSSSKNGQTTPVVPTAGEDLAVKVGEINTNTITRKKTGKNYKNIGCNESNQDLIEGFVAWPQKDFEDNLLAHQETIKNNHDTVNKCSELLDENDCNMEKNRMLDPDAMIESLDRFTAELVSQSSHLQQHNITENKFENMQQSCGNNDTWNDDTSPIDVSFPSISISAPLVKSFNSESIDTTDGNRDKIVENSSTMTESTLIAIEATKIINEMQLSATSLDLDHVKPPSVMDSIISLTSSVSEMGHLPFDSPRNSPLAVRKRSLPPGLMVRRALNLSASQGFMRSFESLNGDGPNSISSCSNLDHIKPPSVMGGDYLDLVDMENSMISVASISSEMEDAKTHFYSETDVFEDCFTHTIDQTQQTLEDVTITEYSDANSNTPIQSDFGSSSTESTPKRTKNSSLNRMTPKQRRQLAKERYKTYTVAAEMAVKEVVSADSTSIGETDTMEEILNQSSSPSRSRLSKLTPKERRHLDPERFQTRVLDSTSIPLYAEVASIKPSKISTIKQRRLEDRERFRTRTLSSGNNSELIEDDIHLLLAKEANIVLTNLQAEELIDCETLSLVSNDDESENNSVCSVNYRTYHKSWGFSKTNLPIAPPQGTSREPKISTCDDFDDDEDDISKGGKPKIVKPGDVTITLPEVPTEDPEQIKTVRGRRKALYTPVVKKQPASKLMSAKNIKPLRTMTSNLVKNVTTSMKKFNANTTLPSGKKNKTIPVVPPKASKIPPSKPLKSAPNTTNTSPAHKSNNHTSIPPVLLKKRSSSNSSIPLKPSKSLERQGTFTKDDKKPPTSKIPESRIPTTKLPRGTSNTSIQSKNVSASSSNRSLLYSRSPSADRDFGFRFKRQIHNSSSSQSLQGTETNQSTTRNSSTKRSSIPNMTTQRSHSNISITSSDSVKSTGKKPVVSRIAGLWKKTEASSTSTADKQKTAAKKPSIPVASKQKPIVKMRKKNPTNSATNGEEPTKRLSRLGSFIQVEEIPVT